MDFNLEELNNLSPEQQALALQMLEEYTLTGQSETYTDLIQSDYDEVPVDIHTFLHDRQYLGNALYDQDGRFTLFPYWEKKLENIFPTNTTTAYNTIIFSGAIGLGKTLVAVVCMLYMLYRLLCLKDPYLYYGLQPIDKITISFMNISLENAKGVAMDKMNQMLLSSTWFMGHGKMGGVTNLEYRPNKHIELVAASSNNQIVGRALFCLAGDTQVITNDGVFKLQDLVDKEKKFITFADNTIQLSNLCKVKPTIKTNEEYKIELADNTIIECTSNHKFMLYDKQYKSANQLQITDKLITDCGSIGIKSIYKLNLIEQKQFYDVIECTPYHNFGIKTNTGIIFSHNCSFEDEVNFGAMTNNVEKLKKKMMTLIAQIDARMKSRFLRGTYLPTLNIIASSKASDQSFLDEYINSKKKNESKTTLIVDEPQWVVDSRKDSPIHFYVAVGNKFLSNELLPKDAPQILVDEYRAKGYQLLSVPEGYYEDFQNNIDQALTDIAGISTASSLKYISGVRWNEVKIDTYQNPFVKDIIEVGTGVDDISQYYDYFDLTRVSPELMAKPLFIHLDMSVKGDKTGISGVYIICKKPKIDGQDASRELFYRAAFSVSIKAPKGREISFDKNRTFIRWLRDQGFSIKSVSCDSFQSSQIKQQLIADGFNVETISVDRVDTEKKICLPYAYFKSTLYDRRIEVYQECNLLTDEVLGLERESDGHIQHPEQGTQGSKDQCDALVGSLYNASQHADEFAFEYGEDIDSTISANNNEIVTYDQSKKQIEVDMEEILKDLYDPLKEKSNSNFTDFGLGSARQLQNDMYMVSNGIII